MSNQLLIGLPEIAAYLRCSVRKLHYPEIKREMVRKGILFKRKSGSFGQEVWAALSTDLDRFMKEKATDGKPL